CARGFWDSW
nr:immunoglobulin heavy chain junction region [Macaca mulatta]MOW47173.1 immunoglobulin heavy chain junction region [Macaca mulatta]MOW47525.1 immunoglobulin heavy chain junction region [Macaca mulatta]MOW48231.1 immunoglobulin heavy chain junction region [Macaca mulatta]MOW50219.1 immunoglobulin heavy chain junction region [Macaca mulatta]